MLRIVKTGLDDPRVLDLLRVHFEACHAVTPPESAHVFDVSRLKDADVHFWSAWEGDTLMGVGALKCLDLEHGEVKSMHTSKEARRRGVGSAIVQHILTEAKQLGLKRLSLETGSFGFFEPARALYARHGFVLCEPFGDYQHDPYSSFMTREI